jgi:hypothetical protein
MTVALSRSASGADGPPAAEFLPPPPHPTGPDVTPSRGFLRHEGRLLGWVLALVAAAAVLVAVGLTLAKDDLGGLFGDDPPSRTDAGSATTRTPPPIEVVAATSFDPFARDDDKLEKEDQAAFAIDGDPTSAWETEGYDDNFAEDGFKRGVGLVLDLGDPKEVGRLTLTLAPEGGSTLRIYGSNDRPLALDGWKPLSEPQDADETARFELDGSYRYLLVWFTSLPQDEGGKFRGGVANVVLRQP